MPGKVPGAPVASLNKDGKLHFNTSAVEQIILDASSLFKIGVDESAKKKTTLYLVRSAQKTLDTFKVTKTGRNMYLSTKPVFAALKIDYEKRKIVFSVSCFVRDSFNQRKDC